MVKFFGAVDGDRMSNRKKRNNEIYTVTELLYALFFLCVWQGSLCLLGTGDAFRVGSSLLLPGYLVSQCGVWQSSAPKDFLGPVTCGRCLLPAQPGSLLCPGDGVSQSWWEGSTSSCHLLSVRLLIDVIPLAFTMVLPGGLTFDLEEE